ncbi:MAG: UDP-3-O-(3-hydroxymyristoyl)glucosamine N-acyltransferase [Cyanobacteriota/Melainabacteria group bacterium]
MKLPMPMSASQIAGFIGGTVEGDGNALVSGIAVDPFGATREDIALVTDSALLKKLDQCKAKIVIVPQGTKTSDKEQVLITVERPKLAIQRICTALKPQRFLPAKGVHETAVVDPTAEVSEEASVGPYVVIGPNSKIGAGTFVMAHTVIGGKVNIGDNCLIHPGCLIADYVRIGNRVILQQGANLGADGFGYTTEKPANAELLTQGKADQMSDDRNPLLKIPQIGTVIIEDDVEIGAYSTIDRATIGATVIGQGTKVDNLVLIAHNCQFGNDAIVVGHTAVGGSCKIGDRAIMAGGVRLRDHITVGKDAIIEGCAAVVKDVPERDIQVGMPAINAREYLKVQMYSRKLPKMNAELRELKERLKQLESRLLDKQLQEQS